jgi:hypothetical protein
MPSRIVIAPRPRSCCGITEIVRCRAPAEVSPQRILRPPQHAAANEKGSRRQQRVKKPSACPRTSTAPAEVRAIRESRACPPAILESGRTVIRATYNCRAVAGSQIRSMHAYGAALDINTAFANYWRWDSKSGSEPIWKNRIPIEIVRVFERHGFIWGGYWYHYDTMHFEYRPELLSEVSDK